MSITRLLAGVAGVVLTVGMAASAQAAPAEPEARPMIIDGYPGENPIGAARLYIDGQETCTSTLVAPEWIVTAQQCVAGSAPSSVSFNIGHVDATQGEQATATEIIEHETADLALVKLDHAVESEYASLGNPGDVHVGQEVTIYGWGATCTDLPEAECQSPVLRFADMNVTETACGDSRGGTAICATKGRLDAVPGGGDFGGPMILAHLQVLVGVGSTSDRVESAAYTNITEPEYREWIRSVAGV